MLPASVSHTVSLWALAMGCWAQRKASSTMAATSMRRGVCLEKGREIMCLVTPNGVLTRLGNWVPSTKVLWSDDARAKGFLPAAPRGAGGRPNAPASGC